MSKKAVHKEPPAPGPKQEVSPSSDSSRPSITRQIKYSVALDLHNTLDDGSHKGTIPPAHVEALSKLLEFRSDLIVGKEQNSVATFHPWICSYIGRSLDKGPAEQAESQRKRSQAAATQLWLAKKVGLNPRKVVKPTEGHLFLEIVDRKQWSSHHTGELNGKCANLIHHGTQILVDDNLHICQECAAGGILPYHIRTKPHYKRFKNADLASAGIYHTSVSSFPEAVEAIIEDVNSGQLTTKLQVLASGKQW